MKKDWLPPRLRYYYGNYFEDKPLHFQVIKNLINNGYKIRTTAYGETLTLDKPKVMGCISVGKTNIALRCDESHLTTDLKEKKIEVYDATHHNMTITPSKIKSPTIQANFLPDGNLKDMHLAFEVHNALGQKIVFSCEIIAEKQANPRVILTIKECEERYCFGDLVDCIYEKTDLRYYNEEQGKLEYNTSKARIDEDEIKEKLSQWKRLLLLEYQTSDAKALYAVFSFFEQVMQHRKTVHANYLCHNSFSSLVVRCMECLGKYIDEVSQSVSSDFELVDETVIKHLLRYVQKG